MFDLMFTAGQALSVVGLAYGWFLTFTYWDPAGETPVVREKTTLPHHLAMA